MFDEADDGSVTVWLQQLKAGDRAALRPLWDGYFARLVALARRRLRSVPRSIADGEDVALSAFDSFCQGVVGGRFADLDDRDDLWRLLFVITTRKAVREIKYERAQKRGGGKVVSASSLGTSEDGAKCVLDTTIGREPSPDFTAEVAEESRRLLAALGNDQLSQLAVWKMEGYTNAEIAVKIGRSIPTVERKLAGIRRAWTGQA